MAERKEFTAEEKAEFIMNNFQVKFWANKDLLLAFDKVAKEKGFTRKDAIIKLMQKFVDKNSKGDK